MSNHHLHRSADRLLFYYFTISFPFEFQAEVFASRVAKPECRTTIFTGRPAVFASRVAKPECRTTIFTSRPDRLLFYYLSISFLFGSRQRFFACRAANPTRAPHPSIFQRFFLHLGQPFLHVGSRFCMSAKRIPRFDRLPRSGTLDILNKLDGTGKLEKTERQTAKEPGT